MNKKLLAKWESRGGKYWVGLWREDWQGQDSYCYRSESGGGNMGCVTLGEAIAHCEKQASYCPSRLTLTFADNSVITKAYAFGGVNLYVQDDGKINL